MLTNIKVNDKVLVTTDNWFTAPDGKDYKAVFGTIKGVVNAKEALGITVNARSTDWYLEIGNMVIAGCQIHYIVKTDEAQMETSFNWSTEEKEPNKETILITAPNKIWDADNLYRKQLPLATEGA